MSNYKSISNRLYDVLIKKDSFVPEGQSKEVEYTQLVLAVKIHGEETEIPIKLTNMQSLVITASDITEDESPLLPEDIVETTPKK